MAIYHHCLLPPTLGPGGQYVYFYSPESIIGKLGLFLANLKEGTTNYCILPISLPYFDTPVQIALVCVTVVTFVVYVVERKKLSK